MTVGRRELLGSGAGLLVASVLLGPLLGPGYVLIRDMVFVPEWPLTRELLGLADALPRAVPSDLVVALPTHVVPGHVVQKVVLVGAIAGGFWGLLRLLPDRIPVIGRLAGGVYFVWNAWLYERLLLGHWPLLIAYATLPWAVAWAREAIDDDGPISLPGSLVIAGLTGGAGLALVLPTTLATLWWPKGRHLARRQVARASVVALATTTLMALSWVLPTLLRSGDLPLRPSAFELFAARADTPFGTVGSLLTLGGAWNALTAPTERALLLPASLTLLLALAGIGGLVVLWRAGDRHLTGALGLAGTASLFLVVAVATPVAIDLLADAVTVFPGLSILRDAQKFVAPLALAEAVGLAALVGRLLVPTPLRPSGVLAATTLGLLPFAVLPSMAWGLGGQLAAVDYPPEWFEARSFMEQDPRPGDVLVLPWTLYQRLPFNPDRVVLSPAQRFFPRNAVVADDLVIGDEVLRGERAAARAAEAAVTSGRALADALPELGIRYVFVARPDGATSRQLAGLERVVDGDAAQLFRVSGRVAAEPRHGDQPPALPVLFGDLAAITALTVMAVKLRRRRGHCVSCRVDG